jgi:16S rRNA pseudouridine516 synthase
MSAPPTSLRLDRLLANLGYGARKAVQQMVRDGLVILDGQVVEDADQRIAITPDLSARMSVDGEPLDPPPGLTLMLNKPLGVTCSRKEAGPLVFGLFPARWQVREPALSTVGRLDKETSGLLLLTDDGTLLHRIISPKNHVPKRYRVTLKWPMHGGEAAAFASGTLMLEGEDKPLLPATMETLSPTTAVVTITEGRYHQVRRMFAAVRNRVVGLHRESIGRLTLPGDLAPGSYRILSAADTTAAMTPP